MKTLVIVLLFAFTGRMHAYWVETTERPKGSQAVAVFSQGAQTVKVPIDQIDAAERVLGEFLDREAAAKKENVAETIKQIGSWGDNPCTRFWFEVLRGEVTLKIYEDGLKIATLTPADAREIRSLLHRAEAAR